MTCKQLGGACDKEFHAKTFDEIAEMSKKHGMEMYKKGDAKHLKAILTHYLKTNRGCVKWKKREITLIKKKSPLVWCIECQRIYERHFILYRPPSCQKLS